MLLIPDVQLPHATLKLREISIGEAIALLKLNPETHEYAISRFLACILESGDSRLLTVQERYLLVAHYISATCEGSPNFPIGEHKYADYLQMEQSQRPEPVYLGLDEQWTMHPLYGWQAEAIEAISQSWQDWVFGCMAAQLTKPDDEPPTHTMPEAAYQEWLQERVNVFKAYAESDFVELYACFQAGIKRLTHIFGIGFDNQGIVCRHKGGAGLPPARFQVSDCITETASLFN